MRQEYLLTFDVGTTSVKTSLFNKGFDLVRQVSEEYKLITPKSGFVEADPEIYWKACKNGIGTMLAEVAARDIVAVVITTQGETLIPVDYKGNALSNAIVWLDNRAEEEAEIIRDTIGDDIFRDATGLPEVNGYCPVSKLLWIKRHEPEIYKNTYKFLLLEDYLIYKFTGNFVEEKSLATSTGYFHLKEDRVWTEILQSIGFDSDKIPELYECGKIIGNISRIAGEDTGLDTATLVVTGAMDQVASAIGAGNIQEGCVTETTGTSLVVAATGEKLPEALSRNITIYRHAIKEKYLYLTYCPTGGIIYKWFKDEFMQEWMEKNNISEQSVYAEMDNIAKLAPPLSRGMILLPYFSGMTSLENNPEARGVFYGIGLDSKREDFIRAILEAMGYILKENVDAFEAAGIYVNQIFSIGGAARSSLANKIKADIVNKPIHTLKCNESTSTGAAILGSVAVGWFSGINEACISVVGHKECIISDKQNRKAYSSGYRKFRLLYSSMKPVFEMNLNV